jgi:lactate permease
MLAPGWMNGGAWLLGAAASLQPAPELPVEWGLWLAAAAPVVVLLVLIIGLRWNAAAAAGIALGVAVASALTLFEASLHTLAVAAGKGVWDAIFVLYVVWPALVLYSVAREGGAFRSIEHGLERLVPSRLLLILAVAWGFVSFVQGMTGSGVPLAITVPLMLRLGVKPIWAVILPLIGRTWGNVFGSLGEAWFVTVRVVNVPDEQAALFYSALLLWIPDLLAGLAIAWYYGRGWALRRGALAIGVVTLLHGGLQLAVAPFIPPLGVFVASAAAMGGIFALSRWGPYAKADEREPDRVMTPEAPAGPETSPEAEEAPIPLWVAFAPYAILTVIAVILLGIPPVTELVQQFQVGPPFPATETGLGARYPAEAPYAPFSPLTHPGTLVLVTALATFLLYSRRGLYPLTSARDILRRAALRALPVTTAFVALVLVGKVMEVSGQITELALGVAAVATPTVYAASATAIGALGAIVTSSTTASVILFAPLQETIAQTLGVSQTLAIAAQEAGAAIGNAISPLDTLVGLLIAGVPERLGPALRTAVLWTVVAVLVTSVAALGLYFVIG